MQRARLVTVHFARQFRSKRFRINRSMRFSQTRGREYSYWPSSVLHLYERWLKRSQFCHRNNFRFSPSAKTTVTSQSRRSKLIHTRITARRFAACRAAKPKVHKSTRRMQYA
jgi:hypothetical protein